MSTPSDLHGLLDHAIGQEPPLGLIPERLAADGERRLMRRRIAVAGTGAAALTAVALVAPALADHDGAVRPTSGVRVASPPAQGTVAPQEPDRSCRTTPAGQTRSAQPPASRQRRDCNRWTPPVYPPETAQRLTAALREALPLDPTVRQFGLDGRDPLVFRASQGGFKASADLVDKAGTGHVFVSVDPAPPGDVDRDPCRTPAPSVAPVPGYRELPRPVGQDPTGRCWSSRSPRGPAAPTSGRLPRCAETERPSGCG